MKTHLKTLSVIGAVIAFVACIKLFPAITIGAVIFMLFYALIYTEIQKTENEKEKQEDDKG